jgi:glutathione peroxidase-family protein
MRQFVPYTIGLLFVLTLILSAGEQDVETLYDFSVMDIDGNEVPLNQYAGKALLIVNVASKCGFTHQYAGLQALYETYADRGFVILGFPANNFMNQEPGSNADIKGFCSLNYGVSFPMFSKISVKGKDIHPLYDFLTDKKLHPETGGKITWNFNKFLVDQNGHVTARFDTKTNPRDAVVIEKIEALLRSESSLQ